jgi:hypothetical protein
MLPLVLAALGAAILGLVAAQALFIRKEFAMANSADALTAAFAKVADALKAEQAKNADLTAQLAAVDPTAPADLAADETAIAAVVSQADALVPPAAAPAS